MDGLAENLYPMTDEDAMVLWECLGLSVEELEEMKHDEQTQTHANAPAGKPPLVV